MIEFQKLETFLHLWKEDTKIGQTDMKVVKSFDLLKFDLQTHSRLKQKFKFLTSNYLIMVIILTFNYFIIDSLKHKSHKICKLNLDGMEHMKLTIFPSNYKLFFGFCFIVWFVFNLMIWESQRLPKKINNNLKYKPIFCLRLLTDDADFSFFRFFSSGLCRGCQILNGLTIESFHQSPKQKGKYILNLRTQKFI